MRNLIDRTAWLVLALLGALLFVWAYPRTLPLMPEAPTVGRAEAIDIGLDAIRSFVDVPEDARVEARLETDQAFERRLIGDLHRAQLEGLRSHRLGRHLVSWSVRVPDDGLDGLDGAAGGDHRARVSLHGEVLSVRAGMEDRDRVLGEDQARRAAQEVLSHYIDLSHFDSPFVFRRPGRPGSLEVRFPILELPVPVDGLSYGLGVYFEGDQVAGWGTWLTDTQAALNALDVRSWTAARTVRLALVGILFLILATAFYRYYDAGKLRLRRSIHLSAVVAAAGLVWSWFYLQGTMPGPNLFGRPLELGLTLLFVALMAFVTFLTVGVGEALARQRWHHRLAAFEALCQGDFRNATVARAALHGLCGGVLLAGVSTVLVLPLGWFGAGPLAGRVLDLAYFGGQHGLPALLADLFFRLVPHLILLLVMVPWLIDRLGVRWGAILALVASALMITPPLQPVPFLSAAPWLLLVSALPLFLFLYSDLFASVLAAVLARMMVLCYPLLQADDPWMRYGGAAALALVVTGPLVSLRWLGSERSFTYRFDPLTDVPADVLERIRERERQQVELETGRQIQAAILPRLPETLHGVEIAHTFTPATEIGGDFYHVLPLDDGRRLAVALGDVAGHGVASGLVMSAVRGALEVHVRFESAVDQVFGNINRLLYEGGGLRLLTTLAYGVLDPQTGRLVFAGAGQIWWVVRTDGTVEELQPAVYPLGVRATSNVAVRTVDLGPGDALFLASDGVVEALCERGEDLFGYERLAESLARCAGCTARDILDGVEVDLQAHTGGTPADDDRTLLVLRLPEANESGTE